MATLDWIIEEMPDGEFEVRCRGRVRYLAVHEQEAKQWVKRKGEREVWIWTLDGFRRRVRL